MFDDLGHIINRLHGIRSVFLDEADLESDVLSRRCGLAGEFLDLVGHDGESTTGFTGAGGFDGRVERQKVCLLGDLVDEFHDFSDLSRGLVELEHKLACLAGLRIRLAGDFRFLGAVASDLLDG